MPSVVDEREQHRLAAELAQGHAPAKLVEQREVRRNPPAHQAARIDRLVRRRHVRQATDRRAVAAGCKNQAGHECACHCE